MKNRKRWTACLLAGLMAVSLTGCGGSGETAAAGATAAGTSAAATQAGTAAKESASATQAEGQAEPKKGGVFRSAEAVVPMSFFTVTASSTNADLFIAPAIEPLARIYKDGTYDLLLAESMVRDDEKLTLTVKLREGIQFTDGSDLNAEVLKWTFDTALAAGRAASLGNPTEVKVLDDYTVEIHFATFSLEWENLIGKMYMHSKKAYEEHGEDWCKVNMVGTGPYKLESYEADTKLTFVKNEDYWQGEPYLDGIEVICLTEGTTAASAFLNKEVDFYNSDNSQIIDMILAAGYENQSLGMPGDISIGVFYPNSTVEGDPWNNVAVRQAVFRYGIDWDAVAFAAKGKYAYASNQFGITGSYHFDDELEDPAYDAEKAKSLLADAGYPDGFDTTIFCTASNSKDATAIQASLSELGIRAEVQVVTTLTDLRESGTTPGLLLGLSPGYLDIASTLKRVYSREGSYGKVMNVSDEYEDALTKALSAKTLEEKKQYLKECSRLLSYDECVLEAMWICPAYLFSQDYVEGMNRNRVAYGYSAEDIWLNQ